MKRGRFDRFERVGAAGEPAAPGRDKDQIAAGEFGGIEIVVRPERDLPGPARFQIHFEEVVFSLFPLQIRADAVVVSPFDHFVEAFVRGSLGNRV